MDDFEYGYVDGHHTFHKEDENGKLDLRNSSTYYFSFFIFAG
jgi:hypothetical protein